MKFVLGLITVMSFFWVSVCPAEEFPYRKDYPGVPTIELADLKTEFDRGGVLIIDVRSGLEFDTIHIGGAIHVPMSNAAFEERIHQLAAQNSGKKIAMYCNGVTCLKSYNGAQRAIDAGVAGVYCFDAGIPAWANAYPAETLLLGKKITNPAKQLIADNTFKELCLDFPAFKQKASEAGTVVIDARDAIQKTQDIPGLLDVKHIPLDKFIRNVVHRGVMKKNTLLIFDQVGKQVNWLMYHLAENGYADFYFLKGGATSVLKEQEYRDS